MIRQIHCAQFPDEHLTLSCRNEPDDGRYRDMLVTAWNDTGDEASIYLNIETASELITHLREFISIMEGRE